MNADAELPWDSLTLLIVEFKFPDDAAGEYPPTASPQFLQSFARFMNHSAEAVHEPLRATLRAASEKLLEKGGWHDVAQGYSGHWALRDHQQAPSQVGRWKNSSIAGRGPTIPT